jgi:subtilisin family serine protease
MTARIFRATAVVLFAWCAHAQAMPAPMLGQDAGVASTGPVAGAAMVDGARDIIVTVDNPILPPAPHAASNVVGYGGARHYRAGQRAMSTLAQLKRRYGLRELAGWPIKPLGVYCAVLRPAAGVDRDAVLETLSGDERVRIAEPLHEYALFAHGADGVRRNDPYVDLQRGFAEIDAAAAQRMSEGRGVEVALVDTGVDLSHPDLKGRVRGIRNLVDDDAAAFNGDRHGTEVAGIIAAVGDNHQGIVGVAPQATLSVYKACWRVPGGAGAGCNTFTLAKALAALMDTDARIINLSLGGPRDTLLERLLAALLRQDRIVVAAMPPDGRVGGFPAATPGVLVVRSSQSPKGPAGVVDAPGDDILTTQPDGRYDFASGSSLAAAHVSGIAALLLSVSPDLDADAVRRILLQSSGVVDGHPMVNAAAAVASLPDARVAAVGGRGAP